MNWVITIGSLLYNVVIIVIVTLWLRQRARTHNISEDFILSGRNLPWYVIAATVALTAIGGGHINGLTAQAWATGDATIWYVIAHAFFIMIVLRYLGPWWRRMGFSTVPDMFSKMYSPRLGVILTGCIVGGLWSGIMIEAQGLGNVIAGTTGLDITSATVFGTLIGIAYVIFAGLKEIGWVNLINAILMYIFGFIVLVFVGANYPGGWSAISAQILSTDPHLMHSLGNMDIVRTYIIGTVLACVFGMCMMQPNLQTSFACKNIAVLKKACFAAIPLNTFFGIVVICLGLASKAYLDTGLAPAGAYPAGNLGTVWLVNNAIPPMLSVACIGIFLAAILSTYAMLALATVTVLVRNIQIPYYTKGAYMSPKKEANWCRLWIVLFCLTSIPVAGWVGPSVVAVMTWKASFDVPLFFLFILGMYWKRSTKGSIATILVCWGLNIFLTISGVASKIGLEGNNYSIFMLLASLIFCFIFTVGDKNARPGYKKVYMEQHNAWLAAHGKIPPGGTPTTHPSDGIAQTT